MLRRQTALRLDVDEPRAAETTPAPAAAMPRPAPAPAPESDLAPLPMDPPGLEALRANMQRRLAAQLDVGTAQPEEVERVAIPRVERRRMENLRATAQKNTVVKIERRTLGSFFPVLPRLRMKPSRLLLVLVALLAGGAAAFLATQHDQVAAPAVVQTATQPAPVPKTEVLVAKAAIGVGQRLTPDAVEWKDWPQDAVSPEYITVAATPDAVAGMAGSMARSEFIAGEPIRREKLARADQGYLASVLDSGMRGVSVSVTAESASGGFIAPNDRVDVLVTRSVDGRPLSETVLQNTRVLAINDRLSGMDGAAAAPAAASIPAVPGGPAAAAPADATNARVFSDTAIATLELDPDQAQVVIAAASTGKLSLALRSVGDMASTATDREAAANEAIRLTSPFWTAGGGAALQTVH